jgi:hypothetical protein
MNLSSLFVAQALLPVRFLRCRLPNSAGGRAFEVVLNLRVRAPRGFRGSGFSPLTRKRDEIARAESADADRPLGRSPGRNAKGPTLQSIALTGFRNYLKLLPL